MMMMSRIQIWSFCRLFLRLDLHGHFPSTFSAFSFPLQINL